MGIIIVGLGPGNPALITIEAWEILSNVREIYLRTGRHPVVSGLPSLIQIKTFDHLYEEADTFDKVYSSIVQQVLALGQRNEGVVYAVPGHPMVGESTVTSLLQQAPAIGIEVKVVAGISFIEPVLTALKMDGMDGLQIMDALDIAQTYYPLLDPDRPALLGQLYNRELASDVKLTLMNQYPDEHPIYLVHNAGTSDELVEECPLYALDHSSEINHLSSLFVPPLPEKSSLASFLETIARLRAPGGCPWDQKQTHQSLREGLVEETSETLDALDTEDMASLQEELGDLLLHIFMHAQIAAEDGDFNAADVICGIDTKIRRRHPHVFGDVQVSDVAQVLENWDEIKKREKGNVETSILENVPNSLSALAQSEQMTRKTASVGLDRHDLTDLIDIINGQIGKLEKSEHFNERQFLIGELLFNVVEWARLLGIDPEISLRMANRRFKHRFTELENLVASQGKTLKELGRSGLISLWLDQEQTRAEKLI
ncbi:MAG: nucleoside triphosphate pyrophosphohydrolase [Anaerolineales bacterium]|nr:nucleoside triphosphate pyrophosphohydrolase [Anaerolineales bacterium]